MRWRRCVSSWPGAKRRFRCAGRSTAGPLPRRRIRSTTGHCRAAHISCGPSSAVWEGASRQRRRCVSRCAEGCRKRLIAWHFTIAVGMCGLILAGSATGRDLSRHNAGNQLGDFVDNQPERTAPVLPLRDVVVFPHMAIPLFVGREKSIKALTAAMQDDKRKIGRAHVGTPVTNAQLVCRLLLAKKKYNKSTT